MSIVRNDCSGLRRLKIPHHLREHSPSSTCSSRSSRSPSLASTIRSADQTTRGPRSPSITGSPSSAIPTLVKRGRHLATHRTRLHHHRNHDRHADGDGAGAVSASRFRKANRPLRLPPARHARDRARRLAPHPLRHPAAFRSARLTLILAHVMFNVSYVVVTMKARLAGFDMRLEEAAADLGATPWQTFWKRDLPADPSWDCGECRAWPLASPWMTS